MVADHQPLLHGVSTAAIMQMYRGGHAKAPRGVRVTGGTNDRDVSTVKVSRCRVEFSTVTPAGRKLGVESIRTLWCRA